MIRLSILVVLMLLTVWEWRSGVRKAVYYLAMLGLFAFFSLRYGQGTDYITYLGIYANVPSILTTPNYFTFQYNRIEPGFFYLISLMRALGVHYVLFVAMVTGFSLVWFDRFIRKFCPLPIFALTCFFAVYSLTYMESGIRQLLALAIILGYTLVEWSVGKRWRAIISVVVATCLHSSAAVMLVLPLLFWKDRKLILIDWKVRSIVLVVCAGALLTVFVNFVNLQPLLLRIGGQVPITIANYLAENHVFSPLALLNRLFFFALVFGLTYRSRARLTPRERFLFNLYCVGFFLYIGTISYDLIASRLNVYFRIVEFALLPALLYHNRGFVKRMLVALPALLLVLGFLYVKDLSAVAQYSQYYDTNPLHYPYITIFDQGQLLTVKFVNVKNAAAIQAYRVGGFSWDEYMNGMLRKPDNRSPYLPY